MAEPLLRVENASKRYPGGIEALRKANLIMQRGEFVCLIGASGCGKSTLLRMIAGFETATEGEVIVRGKQVAGPGPDRGMVFQDYGLFPADGARQHRLRPGGARQAEGRGDADG